MTASPTNANMETKKKYKRPSKLKRARRKRWALMHEVPFHWEFAARENEREEDTSACPSE